jgi:hypothetical protein
VRTVDPASPSGVGERASQAAFGCKCSCSSLSLGVGIAAFRGGLGSDGADAHCCLAVV